MANVALSSIEMDTGIQCRASINTETVNDYAERMAAADKFPPVDLFGSNDHYWIGDGWHRIMAAKQINAGSIAALVHAGGRQDALKHALHANALHGARRTNADKRRCVEIAVVEFSTLSSRGIAELCGVGHQVVLAVRGQLGDSSSSTFTSQDGKQRPAKRALKEAASTSTEKQLPLKRGTPQAEVAQAISNLLATGHNVKQICESINRAEDSVRRIIKDFNLGKIRRGGRNTASLSPANVIRETVNAVVATGHGLRLIHGLPIDLSKAEATELLSELRDAMKSLGWLVNSLKEKSND